MMQAWIANWGKNNCEKMHFPKAADWIVEQVKLLLPKPHIPTRTGIYVATEDVGAEASQGMWAECLQQGAGFANPRTFPWTLSSSIASHIAINLNIQGASYTIIGKSRVVGDILQHALHDLSFRGIDCALLVGLEILNRTCFAGICLTQSTTRQSPLQFEWHNECKSAFQENESAAELFANICLSLDKNCPLHFVNPELGCILINQRT